MRGRSSQGGSGLAIAGSAQEVCRDGPSARVLRCFD